MFSPPITDIVEISNSLDYDFPLQIDTLPVKESVTVTSKTTTATTSADSSSSSSTINELYCSKFKKEYGYSIRVFLLFYENAKLILRKFCVICNIQVSIQNSGVGDINRYTKSKKYIVYFKWEYIK